MPLKSPLNATIKCANLQEMQENGFLPRKAGKRGGLRRALGGMPAPGNARGGSAVSCMWRTKRRRDFIGRSLMRRKYRSNAVRSQQK